MNRRAAAWTAIAALALVPATLALAATSGWKTYHNDRYGYSVDYPADLLAAQEEAADGDGRHFLARSGPADVAVWAGLANGDTLASVAADAEKDCAGGHASYKVIRREKRPPFMALSCTQKDGQVLYAKALTCKDVITQLQATYPTAEKATWDPVVAKMAASLGAGCGVG